jgi:hypothetical protein
VKLASPAAPSSVRLSVCDAGRVCSWAPCVARGLVSKPVTEANGFVLRTVLVVHTRVGVTHKRDVDFTRHAR